MDFFLTRFLDHCCHQSLQIFPQIRVCGVGNFGHAFRARGSKSIAHGSWKRRRMKHLCWTRMQDGTRILSPHTRVVGPPNGGEFRKFKGNGTPYRLFQGNLGWWKDYSIWPEAWRKHSHGIFLPIQLPSSSHTCEFGSPKSLFTSSGDVWRFIHTDPHKVLWMSRECIGIFTAAAPSFAPECWVPWRVDFKLKPLNQSLLGCSWKLVTCK